MGVRFSGNEELLRIAAPPLSARSPLSDSEAQYFQHALQITQHSEAQLTPVYI